MRQDRGGHVDQAQARGDGVGGVGVAEERYGLRGGGGNDPGGPAAPVDGVFEPDGQGEVGPRGVGGGWGLVGIGPRRDLVGPPEVEVGAPEAAGGVRRVALEVGAVGEPQLARATVPLGH